MSVIKFKDAYRFAGALPPLSRAFIDENNIKSVLYLPLQDENTYSNTRTEEADALGLPFRHVPFNVAQADEKLADAVVASLDELPKPVLIECATAKRASAAGALHYARAQGLNADETLQQASDADLPYVAIERLRTWVSSNLS